MFCVGISLKIEDHEGVVILYLGNYGNLPFFFITKNKELLSFNYLKFQAQYSYTVVETLMSHLDDNSKSDPKIRTSIADVLSKIIATAAGESVGK